MHLINVTLFPIRCGGMQTEIGVRFAALRNQQIFLRVAADCSRDAKFRARGELSAYSCLSSGSRSCAILERSSFVVVKTAMQPVASVGEPTLWVAVAQTDGVEKVPVIAGIGTKTWFFTASAATECTRRPVVPAFAGIETDWSNRKPLASMTPSCSFWLPGLARHAALQPGTK